MTRNESIAGYLDALASPAPTPGGGSVAALVSALGCALGEMVCALTPGATEHPQVHEAAKHLTALRAASVAAMARDEAAYAGYIAATRLPKRTTDEKAARRAAMQAALITAAEAPLGLAQSALAALNVMPWIATHGNKHVLSDARIGAMLAELAVRAALINVRINTAMIKDDATAARLNEHANALESAAQARLAEVDTALEARTARPA